MKHDIILFGCGNLGKRFYNFIGEDNILYFCDNNKAKIDSNFLSKPVISCIEFDRFLKYDDIFPIKEDTFENVALPFPNNPVKLVEKCYGDSWEKLPDDVGENHSGIIMNG